jgi:hypothetical protein
MLNPLHVSADMKAATYSTLRLLIDGGQLVLPASAMARVFAGCDSAGDAWYPNRKHGPLAGMDT